MALTRFKKRAWRGQNSAGTEPLWHIAPGDLRRGEVYLRLVAICGYTIESALMYDIAISKAQKMTGTCQRCLKKAGVK